MKLLSWDTSLCRVTRCLKHTKSNNPDITTNAYLPLLLAEVCLHVLSIEEKFREFY